MKTLLWFATIIWFLLSWWWYVCPHKHVCPFGKSAHTSKIVEETTATEKIKPLKNDVPEASLDGSIRAKFDAGHLVFNWSSDNPVSSDQFPTYRDSILGTLDKNDLLEIAGEYFSEETNNSSFANLGLARANQIKSLFPSLADNRFQLRGQLISRSPSKERNNPFLGSVFRRIVNNESVKEIAGKIVINFPHASDEMHDNEEVNSYLDDVVARLKQSKEKVQLVGHTDNTASAARNMRLGMKRANAIKNLLIKKGLPTNRIVTKSRGEEDPITSNATDKGRKQNRRVELTIN